MKAAIKAKRTNEECFKIDKDCKVEYGTQCG